MQYWQTSLVLKQSAMFLLSNCAIIVFCMFLRVAVSYCQTYTSI